MNHKKRKNRIGQLNESPLHFQLKQYYRLLKDLLEQKVDGKFIDIVRGKLLIEIQTGSFSKIKSKLYFFFVRNNNIEYDKTKISNEIKRFIYSPS